MRDPTDYELGVGRAIISVFGVDKKVVRFGDDGDVNDCFVISAPDCPVDGVTSYGTVGLSHVIQKAGSSDVRVEVVGACASETPHIDNLVASCVFENVRNGSNIIYGSCIRDIITQYGISRTLRHVTFVAPFLWQGLDRLMIGEQAVHCLMTLPVSEPEVDYLERNGIDALERLFDQEQIDIFDINRPSVVQ